MLNAPYRDRLTKMISVRIVSGWQLKVYSICGESTVEGDVVEAALQYAAENVQWPEDAPVKYGFLTLHSGEEGMWLLVDLWAEDILRHFLFRAPCKAPTDFEPGPSDGTMACVWELSVMVHERQSWVKNVLINPGKPNYANYLCDELSIAASKQGAKNPAE